METTTPHTPGPWVAEIFPSLAEARFEGLFGWVTTDVFNGPVGCVWRQTEPNVNTGLPGSIETSAANTHLIAAAPDLLEALEVFPPERLEQLATWLDQLDEDTGNPNHEVQDDLRRMARLSRAAIAKAKGNPTE